MITISQLSEALLYVLGHSTRRRWKQELKFHNEEWPRFVFLLPLYGEMLFREMVLRRVTVQLHGALVSSHDLYGSYLHSPGGETEAQRLRDSPKPHSWWVAGLGFQPRPGLGAAEPGTTSAGTADNDQTAGNEGLPRPQSPSWTTKEKQEWELRSASLHQKGPQTYTVYCQHFYQINKQKNVLHLSFARSFRHYHLPEQGTHWMV